MAAKFKDARLKQITTLIFDMDNTLIPTRRADLKTCKKIAEALHDEHDMPLSVANKATLAYLKLFRRCPENPLVPLNEWRQHLWAESLPEDYKYLTKVAYEHWLNMRFVNLKPASDTVTMLQRLKKQYIMALITNGSSASQWEKIRNSHIESLFDCILVSGDVRCEKPQPEIFYLACKYLGVEPGQCAIIGDKLESDIQGGKDANLGATIWIPLTVTPYGDRLEPKVKDYVPDVVIEDVGELRDIFLPNDDDGDQPGNATIENIRSMSRPFRSLSTGNAAKVTHLDDDSGRGGLDKAHRRIAVSLLADMDSCSSSSSSADFS